MTQNAGGDEKLWVRLPERKRRKPSRAVRFANLRVGDQLMHRWAHYSGEGSQVHYFVVTDLWFDPVAGQFDETAGRMVALQMIDPHTGCARHEHKRSHTLRGLASQGMHYADVDAMTVGKARLAAMQNGSVVGIGYARVIRKRPKIPGPRPL
jgi:hypothetical protein